MQEDNFFEQKIRIKLDWSELDAFGHINNLAYLKFQQSARVEYWHHMGLNSMDVQRGVGPILASVHCDYIKPLFWPGEVEIQTKVSHLGMSSFVLEHQILNSERQLVSKGKDVVVLYDFAKGQKVEIPQDMREKIKDYQLAQRHLK